jgi:hypothetical protein
MEKYRSRSQAMAEIPRQTSIATQRPRPRNAANGEGKLGNAMCGRGDGGGRTRRAGDKTSGIKELEPSELWITGRRMTIGAPGRIGRQLIVDRSVRLGVKHSDLCREGAALVLFPT